MKQVTNEVYRTKRKLKLLEEDGIGQLLFDFNKCINKEADNEIVEVSTEYIIKQLLIDLIGQLNKVSVY